MRFMSPGQVPHVTYRHVYIHKYVHIRICISVYMYMHMNMHMCVYVQDDLILIIDPEPGPIMLRKSHY